MFIYLTNTYTNRVSNMDKVLPGRHQNGVAMVVTSKQTAAVANLHTDLIILQVAAGPFIT